MKQNEELKKELKSFSSLWRGGTTRPKLGWSESKKISTHQDLEEIVNICIKPFVNEDSNVLEIGAGGGFWTQRMLSANSIHCFDSLSAKHNKFWDRIKGENIKYSQVEDFECNELEDCYIDYVFSYDVFCHISYSGCEAYLKNLRSKLKEGADCFIMIADANKYYDEAGKIQLMKYADFTNLDSFIKDYDGVSYNGRWYFYGTDLFCELLDKYGYELISRDVAIVADKLNPIIHFRKIK